MQRRVALRSSAAFYSDVMWRRHDWMNSVLGYSAHWASLSFTSSLRRSLSIWHRFLVGRDRWRGRPGGARGGLNSLMSWWDSEKGGETEREGRIGSVGRSVIETRKTRTRQRTTKKTEDFSGQTNRTWQLPTLTTTHTKPDRQTDRHGRCSKDTRVRVLWALDWPQIRGTVLGRHFPKDSERSLEREAVWVLLYICWSFTVSWL